MLLAHDVCGKKALVVCLRRAQYSVLTSSSKFVAMTILSEKIIDTRTVKLEIVICQVIRPEYLDIELLWEKLAKR